MPFHSRFSPDKGCSVYVWHIQESVEELEALLPQVDLPVSKSQQRRKERLAVRLLLHWLTRKAASLILLMDPI